MRSEIVAEVKRGKNGQLIPSAVGKHIRYYQSADEREMSDTSCTLEILQESILRAEHASRVPLTMLKLSSEAFSLLANETDSPMTKTGIGAALGLKVEVV